ncbi:MAG: ABC transporter ATP-binding protein [Dictyoglomi bacterium]|jgi:ABC-2 type transport system ATP-binding protein|nr:ABC transporter ATP-binding protein [Dictyoglomota bacterium]HHV80121.1 ABC transporter ATP-binding protein [bacterium]HOK30264.1 ABC transporter ATP-binding protein [bacterium]HOL55807.1 ABC transporter ATP-binding protein [bacterium]HPC78530.1 ABC transporter ATP-binding protein [bacterium]
MTVIKTEGLSKYFGKKKALEDLNLEVPEGIIFGYLGPNGAGKTTTIRLLLNLARPTSGTAYVLGEDIRNGRSYLKKVGFLPDVPNFYNFFTAREFLSFIADISGIDNPEKKIGKILELIGLKNEKGRIGGYSRGMRQRLGLAQALLPDPELLILDEPTSSLDPQGRKEILDLICSFKGKKTVFFSTHILSDVERICDRIGILKEGRLLIEDNIEDIKKRYTRHRILIEVDDTEKLIEKVNGLSQIKSIERRNNNGLVLEVSDILPVQIDIPKIIVEENLILKKWEILEPSLEDIFLEVTNK